MIAIFLLLCCLSELSQAVVAGGALDMAGWHTSRATANENILSSQYDAFRGKWLASGNAMHDTELANISTIDMLDGVNVFFSGKITSDTMLSDDEAAVLREFVVERGGILFVLNSGDNTDATNSYLRALGLGIKNNGFLMGDQIVNCRDVFLGVPVDALSVTSPQYIERIGSLIDLVNQESARDKNYFPYCSLPGAPYELIASRHLSGIGQVIIAPHNLFTDGGIGNANNDAFIDALILVYTPVELRNCVDYSAPIGDCRVSRISDEQSAGTCERGIDKPDAFKCEYMSICDDNLQTGYFSDDPYLQKMHVYDHWDCCAECAKYCWCDAWSWDMILQACYLYHEDTVTEGYAASGVERVIISSVTRNSTKFIMSPGAWTHHILENRFHVKSAEDCIQMCVLHPDCDDKISYDPVGHRCKLYGPKAARLSKGEFNLFSTCTDEGVMADDFVG